MDGWSLLDLLPGAWFLTLAVALIAALRRWFDPLPRRIALLAVLLPFSLFAPSLLAGRVQLPLEFLSGFDPWSQIDPAPRATHPLQGDLPLLIQPSAQQVRSDIFEGRWPLWDEAVGAGMPLLGDPQAQAFQPLVLLSYPLPIRAGPALTAALKVLLAFVFTFLLLRRQGLAQTSATLGAIAFGLSGFVLLWVGWPLGSTVAWLPVTLYGLVRAEGRAQTVDCILLVLGLLGLLLSGHPQGVAFSLGLAGIFALSRLRNVPGQTQRTTVRWLALAGIAFALAAPVLLPAWKAIGQSERQAVLERSQPSWRSPTALNGRATTKRLAARVAPDSLGDHRWGSYWGPVNSLEDGGAFVSTTALLLALTAIGRRKRRPQELAIGWTTAIAFAITVIPPSLVAPLPVVGFLFRLGPQRLLGIVAFGLSYLAACAVDRWVRGEQVRRIVWIPCVSLGALILWAFLGNSAPSGQDPLSTLRNLGFTVQTATVIATAFLLLLRNHRARTAWVLCGLVVVELLIAHGPANPSAPKRLANLLEAPPKSLAPPEEEASPKSLAPPEEGASPRSLAPSAAPAGATKGSGPLSWLQEHAGGDRVVGLGLALPPNTASLWGLSDPRVNNPLEPAVYREALRSLHAGAQAWELGRPDSALWDLLNVRYILTPRGSLQSPPLELRLRHPAGWVWERPTALPRLFLPQEVEIFHGGSWQDWLASNDDFTRIALVQPTQDDPRRTRWLAAEKNAGTDPDPGPETNVTTNAETSATLRIQEHSATRWSAEFSASEDRFMASSLYQDGGWKLLIDKTPHRPLLANGPFLGTWLPAGQHRLSLLYRPGLHLLGCLLAAFGLTLAASAAKPQSRIRTKPESPER